MKTKPFGDILIRPAANGIVVQLGARGPDDYGRVKLSSQDDTLVFNELHDFYAWFATQVAPVEAVTDVDYPEPVVHGSVIDEIMREVIEKKPAPLSGGVKL